MEGIKKGKHGGKRGSIFAWLVAIAVLVQLGLLADIYAKPDSGASISKPDSATRARIEENFGKLPLYFIENRGQMDSRVTYYVKGHDKSLFFTSQGVTFLLRGNSELSSTPGAVISRASYSPDTSKLDRSLRWAVRLEFLGANADVKPAGIDRTKAVISYFKGKRDDWKAGLKTYSGVMYRDLWPGIDLIYTGTVNRLKYRFVVKPGADPNIIRLAYRGASSITINDAGQLEVKTPVGGFQDERPYTYQDVDGRRIEVATGYRVDSCDDKGAYVYGFKVGAYDKSKPLVVDPAVLVYCGYIGGSDEDIGYGIAVDGDGNAYVTGYTYSDEATFPVTVGPDLTYNGGDDAFVAKVNATGTALDYCGYIGGSASDVGLGIAVDGDGNAYVTGQTESDEATFPVTVGPDLTHNGGYDAFVAKLNANGTGLLYCGYIGGSENDYGLGIAVDGDGNSYVTGNAYSDEATFPVTVGPDLTFNGSVDVFAARVDATGTGLNYCGYIGGSGYDRGNGIAVDGDGNAYVTGRTESDEATFPVTVGPDLTFNGFYDAFVVKVNANGTGLLYCGYIGGSDYDNCYGIVVDGNGNAYVTGSTDSDEATFPVTVGPDLTHNGSGDVFAARVNVSGTALDYCGYIGGSDYDFGYGIAVDGNGNAYVTGYTGSDEATFPVTVGPDLTFNGGYDAFVVKVNANGTGLLYCGYIGGSDYDNCYGIVVDGNGNAYVTGETRSDEATFPVTVGPDLTYNDDFDGFVAKISTQTGGDELAADFGVDGLWHYDGSIWNQLNGQNPEGMEEWDEGLASDFGTSGLWTYDGSSWELLTTLNPEAMKAWDDGLAVDFGATGLWNYNGSSWDLLTTNDPQGMESWTIGLAVDFGTFGLWYYDGSSWDLLTTSNAQGMTAWSGGLVVDFGTFGLWNYNGSSWDLLTTSDAQSMEAWSGGLAVDFDTFGLWNYDGSSWNLLTTSNAEFMAAWASGLAVDLGGTGLWTYDGSSWDLLTTSDAQDMEGWGTSLAVDLGTSGLWNYDGSSWANLTGWDSEDMIDVDLY